MTEDALAHNTPRALRAFSFISAEWTRALKKRPQLTQKQKLQLAPGIALISSQLPFNLLIDSLLFLGLLGQAALHFDGGSLVPH